MFKKGLIVFIALSLGFNDIMAELEIRPANSLKNTTYGIYNTETNRWELIPVMKAIIDLGNHGNAHYFAMQNRKGTNVVSDDRLLYFSPRYEKIHCEKSIFATTAAFAARKNGKWGIVDVYGNEILPFVYSKINYSSTDTLVAIDFNGDEFPYPISELGNIRRHQPQLDNARITSTIQTKAVSENIVPNKQISENTDGNIELNIISPANNSTYPSSPISVRYSAKLNKQSIEKLVTFYVNGELVIPEEDKESTKGVRPASSEGTEVHLEVPREPGKNCNITLLAEANGQEKSQRITLQYVGEKPKPVLHVMAVGISNYISEDLPDLAYAEKDAKDFVETIRNVNSPALYDHVEYILVPQQKADRDNLHLQLRKLSETVGRGDVVFMYFSGHGMKDRKDTYFMTVDASANQPYTGLDFSIIRKECEYMVMDKYCQVIIFMDACHSGAMYGKKGVEKPFTLAEPNVSGIYSCTQSELSEESAKVQNGLFTKALIDGIKKYAVADDGSICIGNLYRYIADYVSKETDRKQSPIMENSIGDAIVILKK